MKKSIATLFLLTIIFLSGCGDIKIPLKQNDELTLNADGSGKITREIDFLILNIEGPNSPARMQRIEQGYIETEIDRDPYKRQVKAILDESKEIDTWQNVSYNAPESNQLNFKGTAFFSDINSLKLAYFMFPYGAIKRTDEQTTIVLKAKIFFEDDPNTPAEKEISDIELMQQIHEAKMEYRSDNFQEAKLLLEEIDYNIIIHLPGRITEISNFKKLKDNSVQISFNGKKFIKLMDAIVANDKVLKKNIRMGLYPYDHRYLPQANKILFGHDGPVKVTFKNTSQLFDYNKEMSAAKENYKKMLKDLGLDTEDLEDNQ